MSILLDAELSIDGGNTISTDDNQSLFGTSVFVISIVFSVSFA